MVSRSAIILSCGSRVVSLREYMYVQVCTQINEKAPSSSVASACMHVICAFLKVIKSRAFPQVYIHNPSTHIRLEQNMSARPPKAPGAIKQLWFKWKTLRLPWRRQFLAGSDLSGNTFWEFKDAMNAQRFRRIVKYAKAGHYSDVKISRESIEQMRDVNPGREG